MKKYLFNFLSIFKNKNCTDIYSIQELNEFRLKEKKIKLAREFREYISYLNKKQRLWLEKKRKI